MRIGCIILVILLLAGAGGGAYWYSQKNNKPDWLTEEASMGDIRQIISATGSLDAFTTVTVGCQISGIIASIGVDFNDFVKAGQLVAEIDPSTHEAQVQQATANLENAKASERNIAAQLENLKASLLTAYSDEKISLANVKKIRVQMEEAKRQARRMEELYGKKLVSQSDFESAQSNYEVLVAGVEGAVAQVESAKAKQSSVRAQMDANKAQLEGASFQIKQNEAQLSVAKINLSRTKIYSPIDGVVISRNVDVGQTVAASLQAPTLFTIAQDLRKMQINTAVDEADIGGVKEGQTVTFNVDAYRGRTFNGIVHQVRLSPTVTQNVVNYAVMVNVDNPDLALKPGMTANVEILMDQKLNVLRIPTRALFVKSAKLITPERKNGRKSPESPEGEIAVKPAEPAQGEADAEALAKPSSERRENRRQNSWVWTLPANGVPQAVRIKTGLGNNSHTEVLGGDIASGTRIITGEAGAEKNGDSNRSGLRVMGARPR